MRVILITPPYDHERFRVGESLGLKYLESILKSHSIDVEVFEPTMLGWDTSQTVEAIAQRGCDLLGISVQFSSGLANAERIASSIKALLNSHVTIGGHFATFHFDELLERMSALDTVVLNEGEHTLLELVGKLDEPNAWSEIRGLAFRSGGKPVRTPARPLLRDLDGLPMPIRDERSRLSGDHHYGMVASRGCLLCCAFCSVPAFYGEPEGPRWRVRSPANVVGEMEWLLREHGAQQISFYDDNFIGSTPFGRRRAAAIADEISRRGLSLPWSIEARVDDVELQLFEALKDAGLRHVNLGVESGDQQVLDHYKKLTTVRENLLAIDVMRRLDLSCYYHYIMFNADTTLDELDRSLSFLEDAGIASFTVVSNRLDVYRGTPEFEKLNAVGRLRRNGFEYEFVFPDPRVEDAYGMVHRAMGPLYEAENYLRRAMFNAQTDDSDTRGVWRKSELDRLVLQQSARTVQMFRAITDALRSSDHDRNLESLEVQLLNASEGFRDEVRARIEGIFKCELVA